MKFLHWVGSSKKDYLPFPSEVQDEFGFGLFVVQVGEKPEIPKPLKGFGRAGGLELTCRYDGDTYRAIVTVIFEEAAYVLHCFQKKSKSGIATPRLDLELIKSRLKIAGEMHQQWKKTKE